MATDPNAWECPNCKMLWTWPFCGACGRPAVADTTENFVKKVRGWMGGGTVGGGDPDDADREPECEECRGKDRPCMKCIPNTPSPVTIDPGVTGLPHLCPKCGASVPPAQTSQVCAVCTHSLVYPYSTKGGPSDDMMGRVPNSPPTTVAKWIAQTRETGILEFDKLLALGKPMTESARLKAKEAIRRLRAKQEGIDEAWLNALAEAHGQGQECERDRVKLEIAEWILGCDKTGMLDFDALKKIAEWGTPPEPRWKEVAKALAHGYEALRAVHPSGHDGDEDSPNCYEDCQLCTVDAAMAEIDHALGLVCP